MHGTNLPLTLIDHDRVEPRNLFRQNFYPDDVGKFKSQVLAERYSRLYGIPISYSILPFEKGLSTSSRHSSYTSVTIMRSLLIGCVDGPMGRLAIASAVDNEKGRNYGNWWLDSGNGYNFGQILLGNTSKPENMLKAFHPDTQSVDKLPYPLLQTPELGMMLSQDTHTISCAEAVQDNTQSATINTVMATLLLEFIRRMFRNELTWMAAYIDMEIGNLKCVYADPNTCARILKVNPGPMICKSKKDKDEDEDET